MEQAVHRTKQVYTGEYIEYGVNAYVGLDVREGVYMRQLYELAVDKE